MKNRTRKPILGPAFDADQTNDSGRVSSYISELRYYGPRRFAGLINEGENMLTNDDLSDWQEWANECDMALSEWAQHSTRCIYWCFGPFPHSGDIGFYMDVESACEDADLQVSDLCEVPTGFSGLLVNVNDHGNVTAYNAARGRLYELFAVV